MKLSLLLYPPKLLLSISVNILIEKMKQNIVFKLLIEIIPNKYFFTLEVDKMEKKKMWTPGVPESWNNARLEKWQIYLEMVSFTF